MGMISDWPSMAACQSGDPDALFVQGAGQTVPKRICRSAPVRYECLSDALDNRIEFGVWGGMTERERRALLRRHPHVASWRKMFEAALKEKGADKVLVDTRWPNQPEHHRACVARRRHARRRAGRHPPPRAPSGTPR